MPWLVALLMYKFLCSIFVLWGCLLASLAATRVSYLFVCRLPRLFFAAGSVVHERGSFSARLPNHIEVLMLGTRLRKLSFAPPAQLWIMMLCVRRPSAHLVRRLARFAGGSPSCKMPGAQQRLR